jgi:hypothetical protein
VCATRADNIIIPLNITASSKRTNKEILGKKLITHGFSAHHKAQQQVTHQKFTYMRYSRANYTISKNV